MRKPVRFRITIEIIAGSVAAPGLTGVLLSSQLVAQRRQSLVIGQGT